MSPRYEDFFLIVNGSPGDYTVEARGPGEIHAPPVPFDSQVTAELQGEPSRPRHLRPSRSAQDQPPAGLQSELSRIEDGHAPSRERMEAVGGLLFEALFPRPVFRAFERAHSALPPGAGLRLKLVVRPPELSHLPWELLYDPDDGRFMAARLTYPLVRFVESRTPVASLVAPGPLRVLYVQANAGDTDPLDLTASERALREGLGKLAEIRAVRETTPGALRDLLREPPGFDVLHYDGHAEFDPDRDSGSIALHAAGGTSYPLDGELLATYLEGTTVRLVVLAACETAVDSRRKRFVGIAQQLMRAGSLPAVVAMQFEIADESAIAFNRGFYGALAGGYPVDAATVEGRKAILERFGGDATAAFAAPDWATPVLFMRSKDGNILEEVSAEGEMSSRRAGGQRVETGGGAYVGGSVDTGGDFAGRDKIVHGDEVHGDKIVGSPQAGGIRAGRIEAENVVEGVQVQGGDPASAEGLIELARAIQRGGITADEIKAGSVVAGLQYIADPSRATPDDLRKEVAALRERVEAALAAGEVADPDDAEEARRALETAERELVAPEPRGERIVRQLRDLTEILTTGAEAAEAAGRAGAQVVKLAPAAAVVLEVARRLFG